MSYGDLYALGQFCGSFSEKLYGKVEADEEFQHVAATAEEADFDVAEICLWLDISVLWLHIFDCSHHCE